MSARVHRSRRNDRSTITSTRAVRRAAATTIEALESRQLLSAAGAIDYSFTAGFSASSDDVVTAVTRQADGKVVVAGRQAATNDILFARFNANGSLDTAFGTGGKLALPFGGDVQFDALTVDGSGNILAAGVKGNVITDAIVARFTPTGALDPAFNLTGFNVFDLGSADDRLRAIAVDPVGGIAVAGSIGIAGGNRAIAVAKLDPATRARFK
jgi:uncharacterized delta-60 repeat protein